MRTLMFDLEPLIFDLEGKNSKFHRMRSLRMVPKNIFMHFQHSPIKTVGQVPKSAKKCTKMTSLSPAPVEPLIGWPRDLCPDATFLKMHIHDRFGDDRTMGKWSKNPDRRTDGQTDRRSDGHLHLYICEPVAADKKSQKLKTTQRLASCNSQTKEV